MKAVICTKYGSPNVLQLVDLPKPFPKSDEVLIKVMASAVNSADVRVRGLVVEGIMKVIMRLVLGFTKPRKPILGVVFSGVIEDFGNSVINLEKGSLVFGMTGMKFGTNAEYICLNKNANFIGMPHNASFEEAVSLLFGGTTALYFLEKAGVKSKQQQNVLIYGASGAVGTSAIQVAKNYGAKVTAVCSQENIAWVKELGADETWAYDEKPITEIASTFDIVFDAVGKLEKSTAKKLLNPYGKFVTVEGLDVAKETKNQLELLKKWFENNQLKAVIDKVYPLEEIVQAHEYVDKAHKKGNVVITI